MSEEEGVKLDSINLKFIVLIVGFVGVILTTGGTWFVTQHRIAEVEDDLEEEHQRLGDLELLLRKPRYTLEDDVRRMGEFESLLWREFKRQESWMAGQDDFRLLMVKTSGEQVATLREVKEAVTELKDALQKMPK